MVIFLKARAKHFRGEKRRDPDPPTTSSILPGITRDSIMTLARDMGYEVREANISREALYLADEIFMTGTAAEVVPVRSVDKITVGAGKRGPITKVVQDAYFGLFKGTTEDKWAGWITFTQQRSKEFPCLSTVPPPPHTDVTWRVRAHMARHRRQRGRFW